MLEWKGRKGRREEKEEEKREGEREEGAGKTGEEKGRVN